MVGGILGRGLTLFDPTIEQLADVNIPAPADGDVIAYQASTHQWINKTISPGLTSFTSPNSTITIGGTLSAPTVDVTAPLNVATGGTGQTSYTNGQLLIGNTTGNTLTKATLTGTTNQVNVTNGSGTITLSLPQNIHSGATPTFGGLTLSNLTSGSVVFAGTAGLISQDNANFFWDATNHRLGIGTLSPQQLLDVNGAVVFDGTKGNANWQLATTSVSDAFTRANSNTTLGNADTGQAWSALSGTWGILSNQAYNVSNSSQEIAVIDSGLSDGVIEAVFATVGTDSGIVFRVTDDSNYLMITSAGGLWKRVAGSFTQLATASDTLSGTIRVILAGNTIEVLKNGTSILRFTTTLYQANTKHGLRANNSGNSRWSSFKVFTPDKFITDQWLQSSCTGYITGNLYVNGFLGSGQAPNFNGLTSSSAYPQMQMDAASGTNAGMRFTVGSWDVRLRTVQSGNYLELTDSGGTVYQAWNASKYYPGQNNTTDYITGDATSLSINLDATSTFYVKAGATPSANIFDIRNSSGTPKVFVDSSFNFNLTGTVAKYNNITTAGWGTPAIYGAGRSTAQTGAVASVATYTVGASDGSFIVSANANVTTFIAGTFNVTVAYTDETNTAQTLKLNFSSLTGTIGIAIAATGPFEGVPAHIRCKASTSITIATTGTFTSLTYNIEGLITQLQ